jgi:type I restriction enzyme M protein
VTLFATQANTENSWCVNIESLDQSNWDLSANNPNIKDVSDKRTPEEILIDIEKLDLATAKAISTIKGLM